MEIQDLSPHPIHQFQHWLHEAEVHSGQEFPNAMSLSTVSAEGRPSARMVLLKGVSEEGFVFFTNHESRKGLELAARPWAALCLYWDKLGQQVRVEGKVEKVARAESQAYFSSRPRGSQIGAWASPQSREIPSRALLEERVNEAQARFHDKELIPVPDHWGGFLLRPDRVEFWVVGLNRLHDRFVYLSDGSNWKITRLAP